MGACLCSENRKIISKYVKTNSNKSNDSIPNILNNFDEYNLEENKIPKPNLINKLTLNI